MIVLSEKVSHVSLTGRMTRQTKDSREKLRRKYIGITTHLVSTFYNIVKQMV